MARVWASDHITDEDCMVGNCCWWQWASGAGLGMLICEVYLFKTNNMAHGAAPYRILSRPPSTLSPWLHPAPGD